MTNRNVRYTYLGKRRHYERFKNKTRMGFSALLIFCVILILFTVTSFSLKDGTSEGKRIKIPNFKRRPESSNSKVDFTWACIEGKCTKIIFHNARNEQKMNLESCSMFCYDSPPIWPMPQKVVIENANSSLISFNSFTFSITSDEPAKILLESATKIFLEDIHQLNSSELLGNNKEFAKVIVFLTLERDDVTQLDLDTDESYRLSIKRDPTKKGVILVEIGANNFFGARHGLETLSQLVWYDSLTGYLQIFHDIKIRDQPSFPYRGLSVDVARNFFPVDHLKRVIRGMAATKLNTLHIHGSDCQSFPLALPSIEELSIFGAYHPQMVYTPDDLEYLISFAILRGVRIIFEVDAPSHVGAGWDFGPELYKENLIICDDKKNGGGHLNPDNNLTLEVMELIYTDLLGFNGQDEIFHIGNDEVNTACWSSTEARKQFKDELEFWAAYTNKLLEQLNSANNGDFPKHIVMWSSPLTESAHFKDLNGNIVVQAWDGGPRNALANGNSVIYSTVSYWYLDCGFGRWRPDMTRGICDPYIPWQKFYSYRPWIEYGYRNQTLGGEVCLWSEQVGKDELETRIWPRAAAFAERVWRDPNYLNDKDVYPRIDLHRTRLIRRGLKAAGLWPEWCAQNPAKCGFV